MQRHEQRLRRNSITVDLKKTEDYFLLLHCHAEWELQFAFKVTIDTLHEIGQRKPVSRNLCVRNIYT